MKELKWNLIKSERLRKTRGASFEDILQSKLIAVLKHPAKKHQNQNIMLFEYKGYIWVIPYVESESERFLKTLYPSRKYTKMHKRGEIR